MDFSIIIVNFNTKDLLENCLKSIFYYCPGGNFEIVVVDNNSADDSLAILRKDFSQIKVIANQENVGFGIANNQGAKIAQGEFLLFLNSDTIFNEDILAPIKEFFLANPKTGIVSPRLVLANGFNQRHAFGRFPNLKRLLARSVDYKEEVKGIRGVDWVSGAALAIRQNVWQKIGGFDEKFFMYFEDVDLCLSAKKLGFSVYILPNARLTHLGGKSITASRSRKKMYFDSQDYFFKKHYGNIRLILLKIIRWPIKVIFA